MRESPEQKLPSLHCSQQTRLGWVLLQALLPEPPRPEQAALPGQRWGLPPCPSVVATEPPAPPGQPARCLPAAPRRGAVQVQHTPRGSGRKGHAVPRTGSSALPKIPPDRTSSSAARLTASPRTPHNPEEGRTPAACAVLQDVRRCFQRAKQEQNQLLGSQITSKAFLMQGWEPDSFEKQINAPKSAIYCCPLEALPNFRPHGIKLAAKIRLWIYKLAHLSNTTPLTAACETERGKPAGNRLLPNCRCPGSPIDSAGLNILQAPEMRPPREPELPPAPLAEGGGMTSLPTALEDAISSDLAADAVMPRTGHISLLRG